MGNPTEDRAKAANLPEGDAIRLLLEQHARIRDLFSKVRASDGERRQGAFGDLRTLLATHEAAEQSVLRTATAAVAGEDVVACRNEEEAELEEMLGRLSELDSGSAEFDDLLTDVESAVHEHLEAEEREEFGPVLQNCDEEQRRELGERIEAARHEATR